jgi:hypothetical protein
LDHGASIFETKLEMESAKAAIFLNWTYLIEDHQRQLIRDGEKTRFGPIHGCSRLGVVYYPRTANIGLDADTSMGQSRVFQVQETGRSWVKQMADGRVDLVEFNGSRPYADAVEKCGAWSCPSACEVDRGEGRARGFSSWESSFSKNRGYRMR